MHGHEDKKSSVMQDMVGLTREFPDYILMAHYHNSAEHTFQGTKVFISGISSKLATLPTVLTLEIPFDSIVEMPAES